MQLGVNGFGRQKHQSRFRRFPGNNVFFRNVFNVFDDGSLKKPFGLELFPFAFRLSERLVAFKRELGIDDDRARRVGQAEKTVGPFLIAEHRLKRVGRRRQNRADQIVQLNFPESAARLFVGKNFLQGNHLFGKRRDFFLRGIDFGQPFAQGAEGFVGFAGGHLQTFAHFAGNQQQLFVNHLQNGKLLLGQQPRKLVLLQRIMFGKLGQPAGKFRLRAQNRFVRAAVSGFQQQNRGQRKKQKHHRRGQTDFCRR